MPKILIVEDDPGLQKTVRDWLTFEHHMVETASNGRDGLEKIQVYEYDLVILDWELPEMTGVEILREIRRRGSSMPVLMLTGKSSVNDKEEGLDAGADDYLTKPFHMKELSARVRSVLRRAGGNVANTLKVQDVELDPAGFRATRAGREIQLLPKEFALLEFLMRHANQVFSAEALLSRVWASESEVSVDAISTCVKRLRKKLDEPGSKDSFIRTVHGVGYKVES